MWPFDQIAHAAQNAGKALAGFQHTVVGKALAGVGDGIVGAAKTVAEIPKVAAEATVKSAVDLGEGHGFGRAMGDLGTGVGRTFEAAGGALALTIPLAGEFGGEKLSEEAMAPYGGLDAQQSRFLHVAQQSQTIVAKAGQAGLDAATGNEKGALAALGGAFGSFANDVAQDSAPPAPGTHANATAQHANDPTAPPGGAANAVQEGWFEREWVKVKGWVHTEDQKLFHHGGSK